MRGPADQYSTWEMPELQEYFGKKGIDPLEYERYKKSHSMSTICGVLREVGRRADQEDVHYLLRIAMTMAIKMEAKLFKYWSEERERRKKP